MNTSVENFTMNISGDFRPDASTITNPGLKLSDNNLSQLYTINSFNFLLPNWDSYGAKKPNSVALVKAVNYIVEKLAPLNLEVFFTTPTTDGDIIVELKNNNCNLEIIFSGEVVDKIVCSCDGEFHAEQDLNETTFAAYLKWFS